MPRWDGTGPMTAAAPSSTLHDVGAVASAKPRSAAPSTYACGCGSRAAWQARICSAGSSYATQLAWVCNGGRCMVKLKEHRHRCLDEGRASFEPHPPMRASSGGGGGIPERGGTQAYTRRWEGGCRFVRLLRSSSIRCSCLWG